MEISSLHTTYFQSPVGWLEIRFDTQAVHAILFVDGPKGSTSIPSLIGKRDSENELATSCISQLRAYFSGQRRAFDFRFSQDGTAFQLKVWNALLDIPYGKTISYIELSKRVGDRKAVRAVGTTNGKNQLSIVVPCHRVIGSNGSLVGYGGALWRKKWLLDHESRYANGVQTLGNW